MFLVFLTSLLSVLLLFFFLTSIFKKLKSKEEKVHWVIMIVLIIQSCLTLCHPMDYNLPGSSVDGIIPERIQSGLPFPSPGDLPDPRIKPGSPALQADSLSSEPQVKC